jgi:DNA-binding XRE family transcriptional regulator
VPQTLAQLKAARAQVGWSQEDVASVADIDLLTIVKSEAGKTTPSRDVLNDIRIALEAAGADLPQKANLPP